MLMEAVLVQRQSLGDLCHTVRNMAGIRISIGRSAAGHHVGDYQGAGIAGNCALFVNNQTYFGRCDRRGLWLMMSFSLSVTKAGR